MKFDVEDVVNGYTVKINEDEGTHVARTAEEVAEIVVTALGNVGKKSAKAKRPRKARGPNKKKTVNADALSGLATT
jgi:hypothetical protein